MSVDILVAFPQVSIPLNAVSVVPNVPQQLLDIYGEDFRAVDVVLINEIESTQVIILSPTRLLALVPPAVGGLVNLDVQVISRSLTLTKKSLIRFRLGNSPAKVRGILRLVQLFLKVLLTTPGSDIFVPRLGAAALRNLGQTFGATQQGDIVSDFIVAVDLATRQLIAIQGSDSSIPADEKLLQAKVVSSSFDRNSSALIVSVELTSQTGQGALANLAT